MKWIPTKVSYLRRAKGSVKCCRSEHASTLVNGAHNSADEGIVYMKKNSMVKLLGIALVVAMISTAVFYGLFVSKLEQQCG